MIGVPRNFEPSSLLYYEQIPGDVQRLLDGARDARLSYEWTLARDRALYVCEIYKGKATTGLALAQMHLADFYGDVGEIGEATTWCEKARWIFQRQPSWAQRHNEAVATYALGILLEQRLFGDPMGDWNMYWQASRRFQAAQEYWATCNNILQFEKCQVVRQYISQRSREIIDRSLNSVTLRAVFDVWEPVGPSPFAGKKEVWGYISGDADDYRFMVGGTAYRLDPISDCPEIALDARCVNYYFALRTSDNRWADVGAGPGDYVFIRQQWPVAPDHAGVVWEPGTGWLAVDFERIPGNGVRFTPRTSRIIGQVKPGDTNEKLTGYIIGLLKPE